MKHIYIAWIPLIMLAVFSCVSCRNKYVVIVDTDHEAYWAGGQVWGERKDAHLITTADVEAILGLMRQPGVVPGRNLKTESAKP